MIFSSSEMVVITVGIIQSSIFFFLLAFKAKKLLPDYILMIWFVLFGLHLFLLYGMNNGSILSYGLVNTLALLHGPLFLFYVRSAHGVDLKWKDLLHVIPFLLLMLLMFSIPFVSFAYTNPFIFWIKILSILSYAIFTKIWLLNLRTTSNTILNSLDHKWFTGLSLLLISYCIVRIVHYLSKVYLDISVRDYWVLIFYVGTVTILGFMALKFKVMHDPSLGFINDQKEKPRNSYKNSPLTEKRVEEIIKTIEHYFKTSKNYLNVDFNLSQLSEDLNIKKHHLSEVINSRMNTTFSKITNSKRIEYAVLRIKENKVNPITFEGLGYESGYKNKSTFFHNFKQFTGCTPNEYQKQISTD